MKILHRVLFIRHGETEGNTRGCFIGHTDSPLTELGEEQARHAAEAIVAFNPDRIYTSPLSRCKSIADSAAERLGIEPEINDDLIELGFGIMEGKPYKNLGELGFRFPWPRDEEGRSIPCEGGESHEAAYERAERILDLIREGKGRTVCVAHGGIIRCIFGKLFGIPFERIWWMRLVNVASMVITYNDFGKLIVEGIGYTPEEVVERCENESLYDTFGAFREMGEDVENRY